MEPNNNMGGNNPLGGESVISEQVVTEQVTETPMSPAVAPEKKKNNGMLLGLILCLLLAIGGIGFGVWAMMDGNSQKDALNNQINTLKQQNDELMEQVGDGDTIINIDTDTDVDTADYIYVGEWGVKIKIPENLNVVAYTIGSYEYDDTGERDPHISLCVTANTEGHGDVKPSFISYNGSFNSMGCIAKYASADNGREIGEYYFKGPQAVMSDEDADVYWETESVQAVKDMLSVDNMSAI